MIIGAFLCVPYLAAYLPPAMEQDFIIENHLSHPFISFLIISTSFAHGYGEAVLFVASGTYFGEL